MDQPASFHYERSDNGIATITLNRPERLNALTFEVYRELTDTFAALRAEDNVRVVVITGSGRAFCSGGDVHDIIGELFARDMEGLLEFTRMTCDLIRNIRTFAQASHCKLEWHNGGRGRLHRIGVGYQNRQSGSQDCFSFCKSGPLRGRYGGRASLAASSGSGKSH